jgi:2-polyprenyl-3-methyl-5-hydroxy-6-metoxy-1,4-benzoquinol methylase
LAKRFDKSSLVRIIGFPALLIHGDLLVLDRWRWLKRRLPVTSNGESLIDIGCGTGAFTIGAARRGYASVGLSWDERNQKVAYERAKICGVNVKFPVTDVRNLGKLTEYRNCFDLAICFENIEHIINDRKLMNDIALCLKPGGRLLLTTPNYFYCPISPTDMGPFLQIEDGRHVRRGYTSAMLRELCEDVGLSIEEISYCSGFFSQKATLLLRTIRPMALGWAVVLPLRIFPILFDGLIASVFGWPHFSICLVAYKRRF